MMGTMPLKRSIIGLFVFLMAQAAFSQLPAIEMVFVDGGKFRMGCQSARERCIGDERPIHGVRLNGFWIGKYPVTQAQWQAVMGFNPSAFTGDGNRPVEQVSWYDTQVFIKKLNQMTGLEYRLPTEAEWEYAARGGTKAKKSKSTRKIKGSDGKSRVVQTYFGHRFLNDVAWYNFNSGGTTHPVGARMPNELGLYDVIGNVWEWVNDRYDWHYYRNSPLKNPQGPWHGGNRVYRGNGFNSEEAHCRLSLRNYGDPGYKSLDLGFRLARSQ